VAHAAVKYLNRDVGRQWISPFKRKWSEGSGVALRRVAFG